MVKVQIAITELNKEDVTTFYIQKPHSTLHVVCTKRENGPEKLRESERERERERERKREREREREPKKCT